MQKRRYRTIATIITTKTVIEESTANMISITHDVTQYTLLPITFSDANGPRIVPSGTVKANVVSGEGASASIIEAPDANGALTFTVQLVTGPAAGTYRFSVTDNSPEGDNLVVNTLEIEDISTSTSNTDIIPGTPEFRAKSELPPV